MKKTILAMAVPALLAAGSASASINLYDANGVKVDASGATEVQYISGLAENSEGAWKLDDGDIAINTTVAISDKINALGGFAYEFEDGDVTNDELFVGFGGDFGTVTFGRQYLIADDAGNGKDKEFGGESVDFVAAHGDQVAKYVYDNGTFYAGISALLESNGEDNDDDVTGPVTTPVYNENTTKYEPQTVDQGEADQIIDGRIGYRVGDLDARIYAYNGQDIDTEDGQRDINGFNIEADYVMDAFSFAASYGQVEYEVVDGVQELNVDTIGLAADYTMGKNVFAIGYNRYEADSNTKSNKADQDTVYVNATHSFHSNVTGYVELAVADGEGFDGQDADFDTAYLAGLEVKF
ncbi:MULTISPECIES: porin [unclassified Salinivibrio]|uniref:porin n=1 Tax=unclassified Salinivibrio TaxID=2636825 RepID=UPI00128E6DE6|nr:MULTISPECIES: porin [unclassified Salinivibrio]MPS31983.1 porin [Salinivibrio sp. VYel7]MPX89790.1 porin [Salinivibrio sp. VYel1]MPX93377.1 porin [Salinivibrio sp. VYel9]MPX95796.1 porin [Salinivibrio sp. VYel6]MPX99595.1 porin [Salinivibrio sp. VYel4]